MLSQRAYEVAKDLGIESKVLLLFLRANGVVVRSASSRLEPSVVGWLLEVGPEKIKGEAVGQALRDRRAAIQAGLGWWSDHQDDAWYYYVQEPTWEGPDELTAVEAGRAVGVSPATVRQWVVREHLQPVGARGRAKLYRAADVIAVSRQRAARVRQPVQSPQGRYGRAVPGFRNSAAHQDDLVDSYEAARSARVSPATVRAWVRRGHLKPAGRRGRSNLFVRLEVIKLARRTPYRPKRKPRNVLS